MNNYEYFEDDEENEETDLPESEENQEGTEGGMGESASSSLKEKATEKISKKRNEVIKNTVKKGAAKKSLLAAIAPILMTAFLVLVGIIIIIGLVMFFITLPGMVMEGLKGKAKVIGDAIGNFFGKDKAEIVEEIEIYSTLTYLEQMGYDLKGWGFLTDYVDKLSDVPTEDYDSSQGAKLDEGQGVIKNDNEEIIYAKSDFIEMYLMSENYLYTLKNENRVAGDGTGGFWNTLLGTGEIFLSFLTGGQIDQLWSRGFIEMFIDDGLGKQGKFFKDTWFGQGDHISISASSKTIEIKRGFGNNSMTYNLDGWVGRYAMPVDFLLSVHLATMMPDLAYDMASSFETQLTLLLHKVGGGEAGENTAVGYYKTPSGEYKSYDEFYSAAATGWTSWVNGWRVSRKEAMSIMKNFGIPSPHNCVGTNDVGEDVIISNNR